jgi:hypothetical protein
MDALFRGIVLVGALSSLGASYTTTNFQVEAPTKEFAQQVGQAAEYYRRELSIAWTGKVMRDWGARCPISIQVGNMGAGGATTFSFDRGEVYGWKMRVQGSEERILDSVLPHEINHTIFACYFRRPLPRWADEGAASLIEHESERMRLQAISDQVRGTTRKIPLRKLLPMKEYPTDQQDVLTLYAEGYSLVDYLMQHGDKRKYLRFLKSAFSGSWEKALEEHYGFASIEQLEVQWDQWTIAGSPRLNLPKGTEVAAIEPPTGATPERRVAASPAQKEAPPTIRAQTPEGQLIARSDEPASRPAGPLSRAALLEPLLRQSFTTVSRPSQPAFGAVADRSRGVRFDP